MLRFFGKSLLCSAALLLLFWGYFQLNPEAARENGPLESLQALLLATALMLLLLRLPRWRHQLQAWIGLFFGIGLLTMLLRELEVERFALPGWMIALGSGTGRNVLLSLLWLVVLALAIGRRHQLAAWMRQGLRSDWGWAFLLGASHYLLGYLFDQKVFPLPKPIQIFWEEAMETVGVAFIALCVFRWLNFQGHQVRNEEEDKDLACNSSMKSKSM